MRGVGYFMCCLDNLQTRKLDRLIVSLKELPVDDLHVEKRISVSSVTR